LLGGRGGVGRRCDFRLDKTIGGFHQGNLFARRQIGVEHHGSSFIKKLRHFLLHDDIGAGPAAIGQRQVGIIDQQIECMIDSCR
jgi:hypothetical protein